MKYDMLKQTAILDEEFLMLIRKNWRRLPQFFRVTFVRCIYRHIRSIRKAAVLLGLGRSTIYYYLRYYQHPSLHDIYQREQMLNLRDFLSRMNCLADPDLHNPALNHLLSSGDEAQSNSTVWGDRNG